MKINPKIILSSIVLIIIISLPFIVAVKNSENENQFGGFLLNPIDGNSYLAKMEEGYLGDWLFTLPYTAGEKDGAFLFEYYLFLGHIARWLNLPLITAFHLARLLSTIAFLAALNYFLRHTIEIPEDKLLPVILLTCFGSGTGWLLAGFGLRSSDVWVAEAFPFLSAFSNPHFILGMAVFLLMLSMTESKTIPELLVLWTLGIILAIIMPFAAVITGIVFSGREIWRFVEKREIHIWPALSILFGGGIFTVFQYWQTINDPILTLWNKQNITPAPPMWDLLAAFSPAIIFTIIAIVDIYKNKKFNQGNKIVMIWLSVTLILMALPLSLQRRFMFAMYIPISILAVAGIHEISKNSPGKFKYYFFAVFILSILTNALILFSGVNQVKAQNPRLVLENDYMEAFSWVDLNTGRKDIILTSPSLGNFLPAYTGRQVLYGHPFETVNAEYMETMVNDFYMNRSEIQEQKEFLKVYQVKWVIQGPREFAIGDPEILTGMEIGYENASVKIYKTPGDNK